MEQNQAGRPEQPRNVSQKEYEAARSQYQLDPDHQAYCLLRAAMMFGFYRRDEANDPDHYAGGIGAVLAGYPRSIVEYATDARTGLPSVHKFPPNPAEVKEFCETELARMRRMRQPVQKQWNREYIPPEDFPGCRARVNILPNAPQFYQFRTVIENGQLDERDWRYDENGSIWVALNVWEMRHRYAATPTSWERPSDYSPAKAVAVPIPVPPADHDLPRIALLEGHPFDDSSK